MEFNEFLKLIGRKKQTIFTIVFVAVVLTIGISLLSPLKYGAKSRLLVLQDSSGADAYSLSKSNEYLGNLFAQVAYSSSFYDQVMTSQYNIDRNYFSGNYAQQLKKWQETISTGAQGDTGIIEINIYHTDIQEAKQIALAVNDILINSNQNYHSGQNIKVNIIDQPLVSSYPVKPNLPSNAAVAFVASFLIALFYIYTFPERHNDVKLIGKNHKKVKFNDTEISRNITPEREVTNDNIYNNQANRNHHNNNNQTQNDNNDNQELHGNMSNVFRK